MRSFSSTTTVRRSALRGRRGTSLRGGCGAGHGVSLGSCVSSTDYGVAGGGQRPGVVDQGLGTGGRGADLQG